eukprot:TRINITY_DN7558_c0_g2_i1.p1 TRINITY_DN7558_c0_g2~~TRINITY_DN7558_c0_g2_i1.p1  ORF type:complete len:510 (-),score=103.58 TRINITY_DN7558_c0_g2_i1:35-1564(-)
MQPLLKNFVVLSKDPSAIKKRYDFTIVPESQLGPPEVFDDEMAFLGELSEKKENPFAQVFQCSCRSETIAVKVIGSKRRITLKIREDFRDLILHSISTVFHPNICLFLGVNSTSKSLMILYELLPFNLYTFCREHGKNVPLSSRLRMAHEGSLAINWLHSTSPDFVLGNIQPANFLIDKSLHVKVSDFRMRKIRQLFKVGYDVVSDLEALKWQPPEILNGLQDKTLPFTFKSDSYSFGQVLRMIITLEEPYKGIGSFGELKERVARDTNLVIPAVSTKVNALLNGCLSPDPSQRPDFAQISAILEIAPLETALPELNALSFWTKHFKTQSSVSWNLFMAILKKELEVSPEFLMQNPNLVNSLFLLIATKSLESSQGHVVTIDRFGWVTCWFGSLYNKFLDRIIAIIYSQWFHGDITAKETEQLLISRPVGTYIVRLSYASYGAYTISFVDHGGIKHQRFSFNYKKGLFIFSEKEYGSIEAILKDKSQYFKNPCFGSKYTHVTTLNEGYL